jgi:hypothetical protein
MDIINEGLKIKYVGVRNNIFYIKINDREYGYKSNVYTVNELAKKFEKISHYSVGKALIWLKKNSYLTSGSKKVVKESLWNNWEGNGHSLNGHSLNGHSLNGHSSNGHEQISKTSQEKMNNYSGKLPELKNWKDPRNQLVYLATDDIRYPSYHLFYKIMTDEVYLFVIDENGSLVKSRESFTNKDWWGNKWIEEYLANVDESLNEWVDRSEDKWADEEIDNYMFRKQNPEEYRFLKNYKNLLPKKCPVKATPHDGILVPYSDQEIFYCIGKILSNLDDDSQIYYDKLPENKIEELNHKIIDVFIQKYNLQWDVN